MVRVSTQRSARLGLLFLPTAIIAAAVALTTGIAFVVQERSIREATGERVTEVAESLAALVQVREVLAAIEAERGAAALAAASAELQPLADVVERAAGVDYVVITDERGYRVAHPTPSLRGELVSTAHEQVVAGQPFLGTETGTIGETLRAKVPVYGIGGGAVGGDATRGEVVGTLSVGILESRIAEDYAEATAQLLPWAVGALVLGSLASSAIAAAVERRFRRLDAVGREAAELRRSTAALSEQAHEFHTQLHVVHGLVSYGDTAAALEYIAGVTAVTTDTRDTEFTGQPLLRATLDVLSAELGARGARLEAQIEVTTAVDEGVTLVLANLCRNAGEAGATVVRCELREFAGRFTGVVEDNGPGISTALGERVLLRGVSTKREAGAVERGVGLDLVRREVTARYGAVVVARSSMGGARFEFDMVVERSQRRSRQ